jgi:hypothetical protein
VQHHTILSTSILIPRGAAIATRGAGILAQQIWLRLAKVYCDVTRVVNRAACEAHNAREADARLCREICYADQPARFHRAAGAWRAPGAAGVL